jgi:hypothetical protein
MHYRIKPMKKKQSQLTFRETSGDSGIVNMNQFAKLIIFS